MTVFKMSKRKNFSVSEKVQVIRELQNGSSNLSVSKKFGLSASTTSTIWKNRGTILLAFENNQTNCKKIKKCEKSDIDAALLSWFKMQSSRGVPISGTLLKVQAEKFAIQFGYKDFVCNNGWLDRFKNRNNIVYRKISGEASAVDQTVVDDWLKTVWPDIRRDYCDSNIYNADETGVFYNITPDKTLKFKGEKCVGGKFVKNRLTVLVCANMTGTDKRKLLVIGKSQKPRCFRNVKCLPVNYVANKKAWMTASIFTKEIRQWDDSLRKEKRKILLLIDNCPAHPKLHNLTNIKIVFLPANCTSVLQPMDQGVIRSFKCNYRRLLILNLIEKIDNSDKTVYDAKVSVLDAIRLFSDAWQSVTEKVIRNCFKKPGLAAFPGDSEDPEDDLPLSQWFESRNVKSDGLFLKETLDDFVNIDTEVVTSEIPTDDEIVRNVSTIVQESSDSESEDNALIPKTISWKDAEDALELLSGFLESRSNSTEETFQQLSVLKNSFRKMKYTKKTTQTTIDNFCKP